MDIVERLRNFETTNVDLLFLKNDAALEIERLQRENERLQKVNDNYVEAVEKLKVIIDKQSDEIERLLEALLRIQNILREGAPWFPKAIMIAHKIDSALNPKVYELGDIEMDGQPTEQEEWRDFDPDC